MVLYSLGLEDSQSKFTVRMKAKSPTAEPSHQCRALLEIDTIKASTVELSIHLTRLTTIAGMVKIYGERGVLLLPTAFSQTPHIICDGARVALADVSFFPRPGNSMGCFYYEHRELLRAREEELSVSVLDARSFVMLTRVLEELDR
jgi:hypothetical protein